MSLRLAIAGHRLVPRPLPQRSSVARLAEEMAGCEAGSAARPSIDLDALAARFVAAIRRGGRPSVRDRNRIAWCLWTTSPAIAENERALREVLDYVADGRQRPYRQLATVYLTEFANNRPGLDRIAAVLAAGAPAVNDQWARLHAQFGVFAGRDAPATVARSALARSMSVRDLLTSFQLVDALATSQFAQNAYEAGLMMLRSAKPIAAEERIDELRRWCCGNDGTLLFKESKARVAQAAILPFRDDALSDTDRELLLEFVVSKFGDPRTHPADWIGMDDVAEIVTKWLTTQTLQQFFDVVDRVARLSQWRYRRAFWSAVHNADLIRNAQVLFASGGSAEALRSFGKDSRFAHLRSSPLKPVQAGHAVLLLDLGQCIVADWSHDGRCNIWPTNDKGRPQVKHATGTGERPSYQSSEVMRRAPADQSEANINRHDIYSHVSAENYLWQDRVARRLHALTGVLLRQSNYHVP